MSDSLQITAPPPTALVVIVAFNSGGHLQRCIDLLEQQSFVDWEGIIWDNASTDEAVDHLRFGPKLSLVRHPENIGFAAANNGAAALSRSRFIVTLNPDAFPDQDWLAQLVDTAIRTGAASIASLQLCDENPDQLDGAGDCMSIAGVAWRGGYHHPAESAPRDIREIFSACAAAALYQRAAFEAAGGFEERFFCYYEDVDLGFRLRLAGGRCLLNPNAIVRHVGSASSSKVSGFAEFHGTRNRLWTFLRDMPLLLMPVALPSHILVTAYVLLRSPTQETRAARWRGLRAAWAGRSPFLRERRKTPLWYDPGRFSWSPVALSRRRLKASKVKGLPDRDVDG